ncbi:hypothetical protein STEG23_031654, partial [Scotinomys teguina]
MSYNAIGPKLLLTGPVLPSGKPPQSLFPSRKVKVYRRKRQAILLPQTPLISELLIESNIELIAKNDVHLTDTVYKTPSCQRKKSIPERPEPCSSSESVPAEAVGFDITGRLMTSGKKKAVVIRHLYSEDNIGIPEGPVSSTDVSEGCDESEEKTSEVMIHEEQASEIKAKLKDPCGHPEMPALLLALAECQDKLKRLDCVEKRLQGLEAATKGKVMVDEKAWNNLLSRVTLLETEMLLSKKNECSELHAASEDNDSVSVMDGLSIDKKYSVGVSAGTYLSSGYSTLSPESTPRGSTVNYCGLKDFSE